MDEEGRAPSPALLQQKPSGTREKKTPVVNGLVDRVADIGVNSRELDRRMAVWGVCWDVPVYTVTAHTRKSLL